MDKCQTGVEATPTSSASDNAVLYKQTAAANQSTESLDNLDDSELIDPRKASKLPGAKKKKKKPKKKDGLKVNNARECTCTCMFQTLSLVLK